jgi:hypothetical protein
MTISEEKIPDHNKNEAICENFELLKNGDLI